MITKPLLADTVDDIKILKYPVACTPKIDGIRCLKIDGEIVSRKFKPIPNNHIRETLEELLEDGMDGEILSGKNFQECAGNVMREDGEPNFIFCAFDWVSADLEQPYMDRMAELKKWFKETPNAKKIVKVLYPTIIKTPEELTGFENVCLEEGYEGVMIRNPNGPYKCGRSTVKQGILMKLKRFVDSEAIILGFEPRMHNANEAKKDAFGRTERSSCKANLIPTDTLGKLLVKDIKSGIEFEIGTGFNDELRKEIWDNQKKYIGKLAKYKSFLIGVKEKPRFPVFLGIRDKRDM